MLRITVIAENYYYCSGVLSSKIWEPHDWELSSFIHSFIHSGHIKCNCGGHRGALLRVWAFRSGYEPLTHLVRSPWLLLSPPECQLGAWCRSSFSGCSSGGGGSISAPRGDKHIKEWADFDVSSEEKQDWRQEKATSSSFAWRDTETGTSCRILEACDEKGQSRADGGRAG